MTNNFYDKSETFDLPLNDLVIEGEVDNPGSVDFSVLPLHSVIVKETLPAGNGFDRFIGAYRYDGYSLFDILNYTVLKKKNSEEFRQIIDLYIEVENDRGDKVIFSWGEIYYPNNLHKILIANKVTRIVPSKTKELWPLQTESKIVSAHDLITIRNISTPCRINVRSCQKKFTVRQGMTPMFSQGFDIFSLSRKPERINEVPDDLGVLTFNTIFYGRGRGIHSTTPFRGVLLKELLLRYIPEAAQNLMSGTICIAGIDGYRCVLTCAELFNRNDQQEVLLIKACGEEDGGLFRIFAPSDFFSDRAVKSVSEIHLLDHLN